jgi:hypothetical protein
VAALLVLLLGLSGSTGARAAGTGPALALGPASGSSMAINATTAAANAYSGVNIHVHVALGGGATVTGVTGAAGALMSGGFCTQAVAPAALPNDRVFGCTLLGTSTSAAGTLATLTFTGAGNGCLEVSLVSVPGDAALNTYTVNAADISQQSNAVNTSAVAQVLVGSGTLSQCPTSPSPPPGATPTPVPGSESPGSGGVSVAGTGSGSGAATSGGGGGTAATTTGGGSAGGGGSGGGNAETTAPAGGGGGGSTTSVPINRASAPIPPKTGDAGLLALSPVPN